MGVGVGVLDGVGDSSSCSASKLKSEHVGSVGVTDGVTEGVGVCDVVGVMEIVGVTEGVGVIVGVVDGEGIGVFVGVGVGVFDTDVAHSVHEL